MPETAQPGDEVRELLRKILLNQAGPESPAPIDGERDLYRKILINQAAGFPI